MTEKRHLSPQEIADIMGWNRETVYLKLKAGRMPGFQIDGRWYTKVEDFDAWLKALETANPQPDYKGDEFEGDLA